MHEAMASIPHTTKTWHDVIPAKRDKQYRGIRKSAYGQLQLHETPVSERKRGTNAHSSASVPIFRQASLPLHTTTVHGRLHSRTVPKAPQCYHHAGLRMGSQCADSWLSRQFHPMGPLYTPLTPLRSMLPCAKEAATARSKLLPGTECGSCQLGLCAQHRALFLLASGLCVCSSPRFHIFPPSRHKAPSVLAIPCGCQGPVAEGLQKPLCKASHRAWAADFPSATHPTQRRRALSQLALVLTHWEPWGNGIQEDSSQSGLSESSSEGLRCCGQPRHLMQLLKGTHSQWGLWARRYPG